MKKTWARIASVLGGATALLTLFGSGSASAIDEYKGMTYEKAVGYISQYGTAVITSRVGEYLPTEKCMVTGSRKASGQNGKILLDLDCGAPLAEPGHPGNSSTTPGGKEALKWRGKAKILSEDYTKGTADGKTPYCASSDQAAAGCRNVCKTAGTCSAELSDFLGM